MSDLEKYDGWKKVKNGWEYNNGWAYASNKPVYIKKVDKHWELQQATAGEANVLGKYRTSVEAFIDFSMRREKESRRNSDQYERDRLRRLEQMVNDLAAKLGFENSYGEFVEIKKPKTKKKPKEKIDAAFEEINIPIFAPQLDMPEEQEYGCLGRHKLW